MLLIMQAALYAAPRAESNDKTSVDYRAPWWFSPWRKS